MRRRRAIEVVLPIGTLSLLYPDDARLSEEDVAALAPADAAADGSAAAAAAAAGNAAAVAKVASTPGARLRVGARALRAMLFGTRTDAAFPGAAPPAAGGGADDDAMLQTSTCLVCGLCACTLCYKPWASHGLLCARDTPLRFDGQRGVEEALRVYVRVPRRRVYPGAPRSSAACPPTPPPRVQTAHAGHQ